ncbi:polysaccharide biosynthesis/export family protein [Neorhodopirellula lusitana]|nr:polysaccharide biosynthesis/export family protein [Neorhodopirellula lusitana]
MNFSIQLYRQLCIVGLAICWFGISGCAVLAPIPLQGGMAGGGFSGQDGVGTVPCDQMLANHVAQLCDGREAWVPRELDKATVPIYRVEPPDILTIDVMLQVPHSTYGLNVGDAVSLSVVGTFPDEPIAGQYVIQVGGVIDLGFGYGQVEVGGQTILHARTLINAHLIKQLRSPRVSLSLLNASGMQPISGEHLVGPDGTITLGQYGSLPVAGMTLDEVRHSIADHLSPFFARPKVSVNVYAFNSKAYYIITQGGGQGDSLVRLPYTGNETVMDALSQINGLSYVSSSRLWIARPDRETKTSQILPIDWEGISQRAEVQTNYQLMPGDRLYIAHNRLVALDGAIAKMVAPIERIFGFTLLGTSTASRLSGDVLGKTSSSGYTATSLRN